MLETFEVNTIPKSMDYKKLLGSLAGTGFIIYHDVKQRRTVLAIEKSAEALEEALPGFALTKIEDAIEVGKLSCFVTYKEMQTNKLAYSKAEPEPLLADASLMAPDSRLFVAFVPQSLRNVVVVKDRIEAELSRKSTRLTEPFERFGRHSIQKDLYYGYDEKEMLKSMLEMLNESIAMNGLSYGVFVCVDEGDASAIGYIASKLLVVEKFGINASSLNGMYGMLSRRACLPLSYSNAGRMVVFHNNVERQRNIEDSPSKSNGGIILGEYLEEGVSNSNEKIAVRPDSLNLGTIITGLPGTGKTFEAMSIVNQLLGFKTKVVVISPTEEWGAYAPANTRVVKMYEPGIQLNFFSCGAGIGAERFYENLAMLIAAASNAGPYKNSLEKCLLAAFSKAYKRTKDPDPLDVYNEIEEAIIEQHGKRTNVGVRYTKHGENVRAALQNLRLMLSRPEFAYREGVKFEDLINEGVIFDLSRVSNTMKPFFYALILNQVYGIADALDEEGDGELRLLIVLEEAQLAFGNTEQSAATLDLMQRIQDFRKKGVGIILVTHSITEVSQAVRRLCQTKLYFRQSADTIKYAMLDLGFDDESEEAAFDRLRNLEPRTCVARYIYCNSGAKIPQGPAFIRTLEFKAGKSENISGSEEEASRKTICMHINILWQDMRPVQSRNVSLYYLGEKIGTKETDANGDVVFEGILAGREHLIEVLGERKSDTKRFKVNSKDGITLVIQQGSNSYK